MLGIAFELLHLASDFVDVGEQTAGRFAIKTGGRNEGIVSFFTPRPRLRIKLSPIVPALLRRKRREMAARGPGIESFTARPGVFTSCINGFIEQLHNYSVVSMPKILSSPRLQLGESNLELKCRCALHPASLDPRYA